MHNLIPNSWKGNLRWDLTLWISLIILSMSGTVAKFSTLIQQRAFFPIIDKQTVFINPIEEAEDIKIIYILKNS